MFSALNWSSRQAPLIRDQRAEYERISAENNTLAAQLARTLEERDSEAARAEGCRLDVDSLKSENGLLLQQTRDLGRQVRALLREIAVRDDPAIANRSAGEPEEIDAEAQDLDTIISLNFVTFRTISQLQQQNQHLLRATRELGQKLDRAEADARQKISEEENLAVTEAHELVVGLKEELERLRAQLGSMSRERDMLRRLSNGRAASFSQDRLGGDDARALSELKADFDAYRNETMTDAQKLKDDLLQARRDASTAEVAAAKSNAQIEFLNGSCITEVLMQILADFMGCLLERYRLLSDTNQLQARELAETTKRMARLQENIGKQDLAVHYVRLYGPISVFGTRQFLTDRMSRSRTRSFSFVA
jgi:nucleoprotein TPR